MQQEKQILVIGAALANTVRGISGAPPFVIIL